MLVLDLPAMAKSVTCPGGHRWSLPVDSDQTAAGGSVSCPVCGVAVDTSVFEGAPSDLGAPRGGPKGDSSLSDYGAFDATLLQKTGSPLPSTAAPLGPPVVPGYEILGELGRGGMGVVYKARQTSLNRIVALKMMVAGALSSPAMVARFQAEAEAVARLQHPNIVQIHEVGQAGGMPYFALEYIEGGTLAQYLEGRAQPPREAARSILPLARAMHFAHMRGIIHRDLKPGNILLQIADCRLQVEKHAPNLSSESEVANLQSTIYREPVSHAKAGHEVPPRSEVSDLQAAIPKVTDFGLAKRLERSDGPTRTGDVMGTPSYMAPEQAGGVTKQIGPAVDVYALGAILYEMLTGRPPFRGETPSETVMQVLTEEPVPPRKLLPKVPRDLETICLKCLEKKPGKRYATAEALAADLERFLAHESIEARPARPWERAAKWVRRRPTRAALAGVAALFLLLGSGFAFWYWNTYVRVTVEYAGNITRRWGVPEGIGILDENQARHRISTYKLFRRAGQVEKLEIVNGFGNPSNPAPVGPLVETLHDKAARRPVARFEFKRSASGRLQEEVASGYDGSFGWKFVRTGAEAGSFVNEEGFPVSWAHAGAAFLKGFWTPDGRLREVHYVDHLQDPHPDSGGIYGLRFKLDERGQATETICLGPEGRPTLHKDGYASFQTTYDDMGNVARVAYLDLERRPALLRLGFASIAAAYDEYGNQVELTYFDRRAKVVARTDGYARLTSVYDEHGSLSDVAYWGPDGKYARHQNGFSRMKLACDEYGNTTKIAYLDADGKPALNVEGYAHYVTRYDSRGNRVEMTGLGVDGRPKLNKKGFARFTARYDRHGNITEESYFGADGKPVARAEGYATLKMKYDRRDNCVEMSYWGGNGERVRHRDGNAVAAFKYDRRGNNVARTYFDLDARTSTKIRFGYYKIQWEYNERSEPIREIYFGTDGSRAANAEGTFEIVKQHDDRGDVVETLFDEHGLLMRRLYLDKALQLRLVKGIAGTRIHRDPKGHPISEEYYGKDGNYARHPDGYARTYWLCDERGRVLKEKYADFEGRPVARKDGCFEVDWRYAEDGSARQLSFDRQKKVIRVAFFDKDRKLRQLPEGYAEKVPIYDDIVAVDARFLDVDGKPVETRLVLAGVEADTAGARLGLRAGDIVERFAGKSIANTFQFSKARTKQVQGTKPLVVRRGEQRITIAAPPGALGVQLVDVAKAELKNWMKERLGR